MCARRVPGVVARAVVSLCVVATAGLTGEAQLQVRRWGVRAADVRVACPLTIGGSFDAKTKLLSGSLAMPSKSTEPSTGGQQRALAGELVVDLASLDTGIDLRDRHLRDTYLEVAKGPGYSEAVLRDLRLIGLDAMTPNGKGRFSARLRLHGVEKPVEGQVELRRAGQVIRVRASFPVRIQEFAMAAPRYLGVGVKDEVTVQVAFDLSEENAE